MSAPKPKRGEVLVTRSRIAEAAVKLKISRPSWWGRIARQLDLFKSGETAREVDKV